ncbi:MAG: [FeFe] hydrogenase H-cluster radical SAM maturase HydG [Defluviitaleaceae bacterium]|nr:[FeFe] hydrogenase H-cluster radical SAM maturase HydG [Defluviitaleaceae bacterium]
MNKDFSVDNEYIYSLLEQENKVSDAQVEEILARAETLAGLNHRDIAALLSTDNETHWQRIFRIAGKIKREVYGDRVVVFAPLYVSDSCVNNCTYCGFRADNKFPRRRLTMDELRSEVRALEQMGHKRLALEAGEDPVNCPLDYILECIREVYTMKFNNGAIRRINVNIGATGIEDYKHLKAAEIGTYILFQETYHRETYEKVHISGPKADYTYHLTAFDRSMQAGLDDVGAGVLFGLYDYKFEVLALMLHNEHLEKRFGVGFHTISVPRIREAAGVKNAAFPYAVNDETFRKIVAILRLAVPYTGIILSTRETPEMRKELINAGVSQISAGSRTDVGGYSKSTNSDSTEQFSTVDNRAASDVICWLMDEGLVPSFCTACYRKGRTGDRFMELAKAGEIKNVCLPNGLLTLKEYALDYGDEDFGTKVDDFIINMLAQLDSEQVRQRVITNLKSLENGERDVFL